MNIQSIWRFPVKSLLGEPLNAAFIDDRGLIGDRAYALADASGKLGSGKSNSHFQRIDNLLFLRAETQANEVHIGLPGEKLEPISSRDLPHRLSDFLGQPVTIVEDQDATHFDDGAVHIILSSEVKALQARSPHLDLDPRRFRANLLLNTPDHMSAEDLLGRVLTIGDVRLKITHPTERCVMVTAKQDGLSTEPLILKAISQSFDVNFGLYASVLKPGRIEVGQEVEVSAEAGGRQNMKPRGFGF
ncbi:MOSC domain-containing protein [Roseibium alexandrii]|uniref:MOSC domain-containing protein n=2 Tax=Roseibium alexandrii TaxID=388408 RepID=UPI0039F038C1